MIKAAAIQIAPNLSSRAATTELVLDAIEEASSNGANFIVFPETFIPYYPYFSFVTPPVSQGRSTSGYMSRQLRYPPRKPNWLPKNALENEVVVVLGINERDHGSLYNSQLILTPMVRSFLREEKITPSYHERMIWGQGDGSGLRVVQTRFGRVGALACWEHYNPLARYALMTEHEQIHAAQFPGSMVGPIFSEQIEVTMRHHALESGCFVVNATGWLNEEQIESLSPDESLRKTLRKGCMTCIISPEGLHLAPPITEGEGILYADLDFNLITKRKRMLDSVGHYARPELLSLYHNRAPAETRSVLPDHTKPKTEQPQSSAHASL